MFCLYIYCAALVFEIVGNNSYKCQKKYYKLLEKKREDERLKKVKEYIVKKIELNELKEAKVN